MDNREIGCYERHVYARMTEFPSDESRKAKRAFDSALREIRQEFKGDSELFDCYTRDMATISELTESQFEQRRTAIESKMFTANLQFFSVVSDRVDSLVRRVYSSLRPLRGVHQTLKTMLRDAAKEIILGMFEHAIGRFLGELKKVAQRLKVDSYSIGLSVALVQLSLTFKV